MERRIVADDERASCWGGGAPRRERPCVRDALLARHLRALQPRRLLDRLDRRTSRLLENPKASGTNTGAAVSPSRFSFAGFPRQGGVILLIHGYLRAPRM